MEINTACQLALEGLPCSSTVWVVVACWKAWWSGWGLVAGPLEVYKDKGELNEVKGLATVIAPSSVPSPEDRAIRAHGDAPLIVGRQQTRPARLGRGSRSSDSGLVS